MEIDDEAHDIKYPNDVETFATSETTPHAIAKYQNPSRSPIIGYAIDVKIIGTARNSGNSAIVLPRKYALVRYNRPRDSRMKIGNSDEKT